MKLMKNNTDKWINDYTGRIVMHLISLDKNRKKFEKLLEDYNKNSEWDVTVAINGIEFPFKDFAEHAMSQYSKQVVEAAGELMQEKVGDVTCKLQDTIDRLVDAIKTEAAERLGFNPWADY